MVRTFNMLDNKWEGDHKDAQSDMHQETFSIHEQNLLAPVLQLREIESQTDKTIPIADLNALIITLDEW